LITYTLAIFYQLTYAFKNILVQNGFLKELVIIFFAVIILGHLSVKFGQPSLFGKLLVGIILGPSILNILHSNIILKELAQVGVLMLMFLAGLETNIAEFRKSIVSSFFTAIGGVFLPLGAGLGYGLLSGYSFNVALFIGVILVSTSVSISVQTLREIGKLRSREGFTILGAAVIDDVLGLIILSMVLALTVGGEEISILTLVILKIIVFFIFAVISGYLIVPLLFALASKILVTEGELTLALIIVFIFSIFAEYLGLAGIVGAYFAGIMISKTGNKFNLLEKVEAIGQSFFFPIFFVSIGVMADINSLTGHLLIFTIVTSVIAVITKVMGAGAGALITGFNLKSSLGIGAGMVSRGEVALIVANIGFGSGLLTTDLYTAMVTITIVTTVITPLLIKMVFNDVK
jgi:Kef-type K+ transport system membrane component KefB